MGEELEREIMELERLDQLLLKHFSAVVKEPLSSLEDLGNLPSKTLLELGCTIEEVLVGPYVQMLKRSEKGEVLFQKLMGEHEEQLRELVDQFFDRYMKIVTEPDEVEYNPLIAFLPPDNFQDLGFLQSRHDYFLTQSMEIIQEFLEFHFHEVPKFELMDQEKAWQWFWNQVLGQ